ncbi:MAG: Phenoxybenzoate dioxygenase subunit beta [Paracidovorax wautersii]|uniref:Phenoxybenzoate dioxygenase subunit beta n=1 Tax=Paracidovorax wautersii TaxID=1177982 RepID=A0A7V8FRS7_9BURK|nr:MAG: Phenoxybenzoate dioxygenase subunit beta [Paracidovorax wautersii]
MVKFSASPSVNTAAAPHSTPTPVRVVQTTWHTPEVIGLSLQALDGRPLPGWQAGAHVDLHLPGELVRAYSLCGVPSAQPGRYDIAVKREPMGRGGSQAVHQLRAGSELQVGAPRNLFALADEPCHHLLLGGGIGLTPLVAMAHTLHQQGRDFTLVVYARSRELLPLRTILENAAWRDRVHVHLDDAGHGTAPSDWLARAPAGCHVYFCGPAGFMDHLREAARHWPAPRVHFEYFGAPQAPAGTAETAAASGFEVRLARQQIAIQVAPDQSIAQALQAAGMAVDTVCEQGICGSCVTPYLDGTPDHQDLCLSQEERASHLALCCSRCTSSHLTLDL